MNVNLFTLFTGTIPLSGVFDIFKGEFLGEDLLYFALLPPHPYLQIVHPVLFTEQFYYCLHLYRAKVTRLFTRLLSHRQETHNEASLCFRPLGWLSLLLAGVSFKLISKHRMAEINLLLRHAKRSNQKALDLSHKELTSIPKEVFSMSRTLEDLDLSHNKITAVEPEVKELLKLKVLNLEDNRISDLPEQIAHIPFLNSLRLRGNPLSPQFEPLLDLKFSDNLQDNLQLCFDNKGCTKKTSAKSQTPSWLLEEKKPDFSKTTSNNELNILGFKEEERPTTSSRRMRAKVESQDFEPECEAVNGVLVLKASDLQVGEQISMGGFSTIHKGSYFDLEVAVKKVFNPNISEQLLEQFTNEVNMLAKYRHPNIVLMVGAIMRPPQLCLAMELVKEGTLYDLVHKKKTALSEADRRRIVQQMVGVIAYLHQHGIVHRDIKSHNMLLDGNLNVKLCDFGLAKHKSQLNSGPMQFSGTPTYMAPELFEKRPYNEAVDVFALGTLLYEVYAGEVPYQGLDPADIKARVVKESTLPLKMSVKKPILQLINRCRAQNPEQRPSAAQLSKFSEW